MLWDAFISHASEDKAEVARPLAAALEAAGLRVWLDENELRLGDSLRAKIDHGLAQSRFGVVVLSPWFFAKHWPQQELNGLAAMESLSRKMILPVWHGVDHDFAARFSPMLADKIAVSTDKGIAAVAAEIVKAIASSETIRMASEPPALVTPDQHQPSPAWLNDKRIREGFMRLTPVFPTRCQLDKFRLVEIARYELILSKAGTLHSSIPIPISRLKDPIFAGQLEPAMLVLDGRLQWLSCEAAWKFFPESPSTPQERMIGFPKPSSMDDPKIAEVQEKLARRNIGVGFVREERLGQVFGQGKQVVYDSDGLYFRWQGRDGAQILVANGL
jgi:hypothetical protein